MNGSSTPPGSEYVYFSYCQTIFFLRKFKISDRTRDYLIPAEQNEPQQQQEEAVVRKRINDADTSNTRTLTPTHICISTNVQMKL